MRYTIQDVILITLPVCNQVLTVMESANLPLDVKRIFIVKGNENEIRGYHAHYQVTQYLVCVHGACEVICDDGLQKKSFQLNAVNQALLLPPGIWAEQTYLEKDTTLMVVCDALYDEADYIRDYEVFLKFRRNIMQL